MPKSPIRSNIPSGSTQPQTGAGLPAEVEAKHAAQQRAEEAPSTGAVLHKVRELRCSPQTRRKSTIRMSIAKNKPPTAAVLAALAIVALALIVHANSGPISGRPSGVGPGQEQLFDIQVRFRTCPT